MLGYPAVITRLLHNYRHLLINDNKIELQVIDYGIEIEFTVVHETYRLSLPSRSRLVGKMRRDSCGLHTKPPPLSLSFSLSLSLTLHHTSSLNIAVLSLYIYITLSLSPLSPSLTHSLAFALDLSHHLPPPFFFCPLYCPLLLSYLVYLTIYLYLSLSLSHPISLYGLLLSHSLPLQAYTPHSFAKKIETTMALPEHHTRHSVIAV